MKSDGHKTKKYNQQDLVVSNSGAKIPAKLVQNSRNKYYFIIDWSFEKQELWVDDSTADLKL